MSLAERANFLAARIAEIDAAMVGLDVRQLDELGGRVVVRLQCRLSSQNMLTKNAGLHTLRPQAVRRATGDGARPSRLWPDLMGWRAPSPRALPVVIYGPSCGWRVRLLLPLTALNDGWTLSLVSSWSVSLPSTFSCAPNHGPCACRYSRLWYRSMADVL